MAFDFKVLVYTHVILAFVFYFLAASCLSRQTFSSFFSRDPSSGRVSSGNIWLEVRPIAACICLNVIT